MSPSWAHVTLLGMFCPPTGLRDYVTPVGTFVTPLGTMLCPCNAHGHMSRQWAHFCHPTGHNIFVTPMGKMSPLWAQCHANGHKICHPNGLIIGRANLLYPKPWGIKEKELHYGYQCLQPYWYWDFSLYPQNPYKNIGGKIPNPLDKTSP